jgi:peroxiredoxin Q/BCP
VARAYGVLAPSGLASRWTFYIGADGRILDIDKKVRAASHGTDIVKRLEELRVQR